MKQPNTSECKEPYRKWLCKLSVTQNTSGTTQRQADTNTTVWKIVFANRIALQRPDKGQNRGFAFEKLQLWTNPEHAKRIRPQRPLWCLFQLQFWCSSLPLCFARNKQIFWPTLKKAVSNLSGNHSIEPQALLFEIQEHGAQILWALVNLSDEALPFCPSPSLGGSGKTAKLRRGICFTEVKGCRISGQKSFSFSLFLHRLQQYALSGRVYLIIIDDHVSGVMLYSSGSTWPRLREPDAFLEFCVKDTTCRRDRSISTALSLRIWQSWSKLFGCVHLNQFIPGFNQVNLGAYCYAPQFWALVTNRRDSKHTARYSPVTKATLYMCFLVCIVQWLPAAKSLSNSRRLKTLTQPPQITPLCSRLQIGQLLLTTPHPTIQSIASATKIEAKK